MSYQLYYWWLRARSRLFDDERGQNITEYALVLALIAVVAIAVIVAFRDRLVQYWNDMIAGLFNPS